MKKNIPALTRLLLPINDFELFKNILPLVELVSKAMDKELEKVDLLHVVGGSFLSTHLSNIDFRADRVMSSDLMQRIREKHFQEYVNPLLSQVQELLEESGVVLQVKVRTEDGDPVKKISSICENEKYSTLIISRRKEEENFFMGTVVNGILNRHLKASFYVVGKDGFTSGQSPAARVMIGIDGSPACLRAVQEAALILSRTSDQIEEISLVNVLDPSALSDSDAPDGKRLNSKVNKALQQAEEMLIEKGVAKEKIAATILYGRPGEVLAEHAESFRATMCYVGRRNRSKIAEVLLGSVSSDVVQRCRNKTIVLIS